MKKLIPSILLIMLISGWAWGQGTISISPGTFVLSGLPSNNDVKMHLEVTNTSGIDVNFLWSRVVDSAPAGWLTWICDKNLCYLPTANACASNKPNVLAPGEKMSFEIHVNPVAIEGTTPYHITFTDYTDPEIVLGQASGEVIISNSVATQNPGASTTLTVYPNPTEDYFQVSETVGLRYIELFNIVGNKVKSYDAIPQKQYYIGDMTDGIYLVRMISSSGKVLKTIRLSKR